MKSVLAAALAVALSSTSALAFESKADARSALAFLVVYNVTCAKEYGPLSDEMVGLVKNQAEAIDVDLTIPSEAEAILYRAKIYQSQMKVKAKRVELCTTIRAKF